MRENYDVFDFKLTANNMKTMATLDKNQSSLFSHSDPNVVEWFVKMVEERKINQKHKSVIIIYNKLQLAVEIFFNFQNMYICYLDLNVK